MTNIEIRVRSIQEKLSNAEKKVAEYFLANQENLFNLPISILAEESGVSQVAWVRFCKSLGFSGLKDFKKALFSELNETIHDTDKATDYNFADVKDYTSIPQMIQAVLGSSVCALEETAKLVDEVEVQKIVSLLMKASTIKIFGLGASATVAEDFCNKLIRIGKNCCFSKDNLIQLTYAATTKPGEVSILISNSGETHEMVEILGIVKQNKCATVAITKYNKSPIAQGAEHHMYVSSPEIHRRSGAMSSRLAQLLAVDILFTALCNQDYKNVEILLKKSHQTQLSHKVWK